jgi:hypothetical protein
LRGDAVAAVFAGAALESADLASAGLESAGVDRLVCAAAAAATARTEDIKIAKEILFMLDLKTLDSILSELSC